MPEKRNVGVMGIRIKMQLILIFFLASLPLSLSLSSSHPPHFLKPSKFHHHLCGSHPHESIELTPPLPTSRHPPPPPECTLSLLRHSFANTFNRPPITSTYSPPPLCPPPWSHAVLHLSGAVSGEQYDRIAAVWLAGAEILRTSTPEPFDSGTFWNVRKDVTRYSSILLQSNVSVAMMLENIVNDVFTGVIHVNLTLLLYKDDPKFGLGFQGCGIGTLTQPVPADLVIPIAAEGNRGFWFRIENESQVISKVIEIPSNARRIVLELYVSFHGDDEFWYSNPPNCYIEANNLSISRGNGAFREIFVKIDGNCVASEMPFPVVFTGGVNPLFWEPVVGIGAFDLPSYEFELTPFLDGKSHVFELGVAHAIQFWLVDANLHVWLDKESSRVEAKMGFYHPPDSVESWVYDFKQLDGLFQVEAQRSSQSSGWVAASGGNLTTTIVRDIRFKNSIMFQRNGTYKMVRQKMEVRKEISVMSDMGIMVSQIKFEGIYPLKLMISNVPVSENGTNLMTTNISTAVKEKSIDGRSVSYVLQNSQESEGWMLAEDHELLSGKAETRQTLYYRGYPGCFLRSVEATGGSLLRDNSTTVCPPLFGNTLHVEFSEW